MKRSLFVILVITAVSISAQAKYSGGSGDPNTPYQIANATDLLTLANDAGDYNKCFILTADIDLNPNLPGGQVFTTAIIAAGDFTGTFDGNGHKITNFIINGGSNGYLGLFDYIDSGGNVKNLGLENFAVSGSYEVGGLAGMNDGSIINCYSTGSVSGSSEVGGLVGENDSGINDCYSTGTVSGSDYVGGLAGMNDSSIINCYSTGSVSGSSEVGGLVGYNNYNASISDCYSTGTVSGSSSVGGLVGGNRGSVFSSFWDTESSGQTTSDGGTGKTTADMKTLSTFTSAGWDFVNETVNGTCNYWQMSAGDYPVLSTFNGYIPPEPNGSGTIEDPYIITDANGLGTVWYRPSSYYVLANNIDLAGINWSVAVVPVFSGVLDGNGFSIKNLSINGAEYLGLFGRIEAGGSIKNLGIKDCNVSGSYYYIGGLVGENDGSIINCYSTGNVSGSYYYVGGLVGYNNGSISNCYSTGSVSGSDYYVGGLVGENYGGIGNCYSTGTVSGPD